MSTKSEYKPITKADIQILLSNGCTSDNWKNIETKPGFDPQRCRNTRFSGKVRLGLFRKSFTDEAGIILNSGIVNAMIHHCTIGDDVLIYNVGDHIANYSIEDDVLIKNCGRISTEGVASFGNGTKVAAVSEAGARSVTIWDRLSAQQAYITAFYKHRTAAIKVLENLSVEYSGKVSSATGTIGKHSRILNCPEIRNVKIGPSTRIDGALKLNDGSINSCKEDPVYIGSGVIMEHFIICSGSSVTDSTIIDKCFIGQGCVLGKQFSAENSLFFTGCAGFHGEACSVFAGPFTVTHHKSTLLIAALFSFMNAGSGSNQSNHMYKLGPVHQGIVERGSKTASESYMLWPARIGPFTLIMGRHKKNFDSSSMPFSYIIESNDESMIVPGINLRTIGTIRDAKKWPERDTRKDPDRTDYIHFDILSPYTVQKMIKGREYLKKLKNDTESSPGLYQFNNMKLTRHSIERGIQLYQAGIDKYLGSCLIKKLEGNDCDTKKKLKALLVFDESNASSDWMDIAGMFAPGGKIDRLLDEIEAGKITSVSTLSAIFITIHGSYDESAWDWAARTLEDEEGKTLRQFEPADVIRIIERWEKSVVWLDNQMLEDAGKEFNNGSMTAFGITDNDQIRQLDFDQVRGDFDSNSIVNMIRDHIKTKTAIAGDLIKRMTSINQAG
jgi:hypothetical protein